MRIDHFNKPKKQKTTITSVNDVAAHRHRPVKSDRLAGSLFASHPCDLETQLSNVWLLMPDNVITALWALLAHSISINVQGTGTEENIKLQLIKTANQVCE